MNKVNLRYCLTVRYTSWLTPKAKIKSVLLLVIILMMSFSSWAQYEGGTHSINHENVVINADRKDSNTSLRFQTGNAANTEGWVMSNEDGTLKFGYTTSSSFNTFGNIKFNLSPSGNLSVDGKITGEELSASMIAAPSILVTETLDFVNDGDIIRLEELSFSNETIQKINLYNDDYGIGVQAHTQYYRSNKNFAWYKEGEHHNSELNAGSGGRIEMVLKDGKLGIAQDNPFSALEVKGAIDPTPNELGVHIGTHEGKYAGVELKSLDNAGSWIDFLGVADQDYRGRIRYNTQDNLLQFHTNAQASPALQIDANQNVDIVGNVTATSFVGDGSQLTGVVADLPANYELSTTSNVTAAAFVGATGALTFDDDNISLGGGAGSGITAAGKHVFIGHNAGTNNSFQQISNIDFATDGDADPVSGEEFLEDHSVFVLNNHDNLDRPLLFGKFADYDGTDYADGSYPQLGINTHHLAKGSALTVSGSVHIGPDNIEPTVFPGGEAYDDALLWVERGIVTEDLTFAFTSSWDEWPDYVFNDDYELKSLEELDSYITKNKHLPGIISQKEVEASGGVPAKDTMIGMLEKIEELTLYIIDQDKKSRQQDEKIAQLEQLILEKLND